MEEDEPLMLCMKSTTGEEVSLTIEPQDDFHTFMDKAKSVLGYEIDLTSLTDGQTVDLNENAYQYLLNLEKNHPDVVRTVDQTLPPNDEEFVLDDGTEIRASQIHFDNEDALIDITLEKLPFVKHNNDGDDSIHNTNADFEEVPYKILASPIHDNENTFHLLPYKLVCNNTTGFEAQFTKYLEQSTKTNVTLNNVTKKNKSPRSLIIDNFDTKDEVKYTREEVLNMLKDSPVTSIYEINDNKHVRKTDPTRRIQKSAKGIDIDLLVINDNEKQNCVICGDIVIEKLYIFDKEDQHMHRCSQQKITQLKVICEKCLNENFKRTKLKANHSLSFEEYLVIRNNQQYVFQKTNDFEFRLQESVKKDEFVKVEIGSDGEIVTKPIDLDVVIKDERKDSSSDVEIIEEDTEIDKFIDNLEEADEHVKEFLGKCDNIKSEDRELKCRFCDNVFKTLSEVAQHGETHKHNMDDDVVFPCPLCDYGYPTLNWLKGHMKAAHDIKNDDPKQENDNVDDIENDTNDKSLISTDVTKKGNLDENTQIVEASAGSEVQDLIIKTEVKQECLSSEDEIWIVQTADDEASGQLDKILKVDKPEEKKETVIKGHKCYNCSKIFPTPASLLSHKCRSSCKKRKSGDETIIIPSEEDFIRRAQGRPRQIIASSSDAIEKRKKVKDHSEIVTCNDCNQSFTSKIRLKFHMQFHGETPLLTDGIYKCDECDKTFVTETELFDHVHFRHDNKKRWQCPVEECGKTFHLRATLTKHSRTHTDTRRYVCVKCGKRFLDKQTLDEHGVTHLQIKPYQCHICLKQLTRVSRLRMHVKAHRERAAPARTPVCAHCSRAFADIMQAQEHAMKSTECIEAFSKDIKEENDEPTVQLSPTSGLVRHTIQVIQSPKPQPRIPHQVASPIADPLMSQLNNEAKSIIRIVEIDKAFRCEYCEDVFYIEHGLNKHRQIHKGNKSPFTCHICKVSFTTYSRCTTHKTTHGFYKQGPNQTRNDFPVVKHFLCEDCGRSYLHWTYLQVHRRMKHTNDNSQYNCNYCEVTFPNSWSLAYHKKKMHQNNDDNDNKIVTQNYKIPCRDCDEILPNKNALYKHRKKEHSDPTILEYQEIHRIDNIKTFSCDRCPKRFKMAAELKSHLKMKHPHQIAVIEIQGLNPNTEDIMNIINMNNITQDRVMEISIMSFSQGTSNIVPNSARALSMLNNEPKTLINIPKTTHNIEFPMEELQIRNSILRRPAILQRSLNPQIDWNTQNYQDVNFQLSVQDGAVVNNTQVVQANLDSMLQ